MTPKSWTFGGHIRSVFICLEKKAQYLLLSVYTVFSQDRIYYRTEYAPDDYRHVGIDGFFRNETVQSCYRSQNACHCKGSGICVGKIRQRADVLYDHVKTSGHDHAGDTWSDSAEKSVEVFVIYELLESDQ